MYVDLAGSSVPPTELPPSADSLLPALVGVTVVGVFLCFLVVIIISFAIFMCLRYKGKKAKEEKQGR